MKLPAVWTTKTLAEYLRVNRSSIYRAIQRQELPAFRTCDGPSEWFFTKADVEHWILNGGGKK